MNRRTVVYVAGKYRGATFAEVYDNVQAARAVAKVLWEKGIIALCPHTMTFAMDGVCPQEGFLAGTLELMRRCDAVVLVEGWEESAGTLAEITEAGLRGIPVYDGLTDFAEGRFMKLRSA